MVSNMLDKGQTSSVAVGEMFDIEPLIAPGIDWFFWLETSFWVLVGLLILLAGLYLARFLYRPLLFKWQLLRLKRQALVNQQALMPAEYFKLYDWLSRYRVWLKASKNQSMESDRVIEHALSDLSMQVNALCFSSQPVSRETYLNLISNAQSLLKQISKMSSSFVLSSIIKLPLMRFKNRVDTWKR